MKRLLTEKELIAYLNVGRNTARKYAQQQKAIVRICGRVMYDREIIDKCIAGGGNA